MSQVPVQLSSDYYLHNFLFLLNWVEQRYTQILSSDEHAFISCFRSLPHASQCLLVRMAGRRGHYFRHGKLQYAEIGDTKAAVGPLLASEIVQSDPDISFEELSALVTKPELRRIFSAHLENINDTTSRNTKIGSCKKSELIEILAIPPTQTKPWSEWTRNDIDVLYKFTMQDTIDLCLLLFFGNAHQNLTEFVLQDLGLFTYEKFDIDPEHQVFTSREAVDEYQLLMHLSDWESVCESVEELNEVVSLLPSLAITPRNQHKLEKLRNRIAYRYERAGELYEAFLLYQQSTLAPARERQVRLLEKQGEYTAAWELILAMLETPWSEHEAQVAQRIKPRLAKKLGQTNKKVSKNKISEHHVQLESCYADLGVEEACRQYYQGTLTASSALNVGDVDGLDQDASCLEHIKLEQRKPEQSKLEQGKLDQDKPCFYLENQLFNGLFGLWLWPEMFKSVPGAFANPFQMAPLDLYQQDFVKNRQGIQSLWQLFETEAYKQHIKQVWQNKFGIANHFIHWGYLDVELLDLALEIIPAKDIKSIFKRLLFDIKANKSGFPDLIQFDVQQRQYKLIEVKGPNDKLQDNQIRWMEYFRLHEIAAEVCYVSWS